MKLTVFSQMRRIFFVFIAYLISSTCSAQSEDTGFGARGQGLAKAAVTLSDTWSLFNNVGGLGKQKSHAVCVGYQNRFGIAAFQMVGGGLVLHNRIGNAGISYLKFGDPLFNQQKLGLAIGNEIGMVSLGLGSDIIQYHIESLGSARTIALKIGGIITLTPKFLIGMYIFNLNRAKLRASAESYYLPTTMKAGLAYQPSQELIVAVEINKEIEFKETLRAGIEYQIIKHVFFRTGVSTNPFLGAFGIGFHPKKFRYDYSFSNNVGIGNIHEISLTYLLKKDNVYAQK